MFRNVEEGSYQPHDVYKKEEKREREKGRQEKEKEKTVRAYKVIFRLKNQNMLQNFQLNHKV